MSSENSDPLETVSAETTRKSFELVLAAADERLDQLEQHPQLMAQPAELGAAIKDVRDALDD